MRHITPQMAANVLNALPSPFDAHAAEKEALRQYPLEVGRQIGCYTNSPTMTALQKFSMQFARYIDRLFGSKAATPQIRKTAGTGGTGKVVGEHLGGRDAKNQEWEKINPGTPTTPPLGHTDLADLFPDLNLNADPADDLP